MEERVHKQLVQLLMSQQIGPKRRFLPAWGRVLGLGVVGLVLLSSCSARGDSEFQAGSLDPSITVRPDTTFSSRHDFSVIDEVPSQLWEEAAASSAQAELAVDDLFVTEHELALAAEDFAACVREETGLDVAVQYRYGNVSLDIVDPPDPEMHNEVVVAEQLCFRQRFAPLAEIARIILSPDTNQLAEIERLADSCAVSDSSSESSPEKVRKLCMESALEAFYEDVEQQWQALQNAASSHQASS